MKLLRGEQVPPGLEADEVRDRLLAGFQYILVDEYQDIDEPQYEMISAIAGRTLEDADLKLSILAVGDDDQNIYTFRGANVRVHPPVPAGLRGRGPLPGRELPFDALHHRGRQPTDRRQSSTG